MGKIRMSDRWDSDRVHGNRVVVGPVQKDISCARYCFTLMN